MYSITKDFHFSAGHHLTVPKGHPCGRFHGHNYIVRVELASDKLDPPGFVMDYKDLGWFKKHLDENFDHQNLNDVMEADPTAENMAKHFFDWLKEAGYPVRSVSVSETPKTWATYIEDIK